MPFISKDYAVSLTLLNRLSDLSLSPEARLTLWSLDLRANAHTGLCWPSLARIAQDTGLSEDTVSQAIQDLAQVGLIEVIEGRWRRYRMTPERVMGSSERGILTTIEIEHVEEKQQAEAQVVEEPAIAALPLDPPPPPVVVPSPPKEEPSPIGPPPADILPSILELGIPARVAHSLLSAGEALVTSWLDALRLKLVTPRNPAGFLRRAIEERWQPPKERAKGIKPEPEPSSHEARARVILAARYASLEAALSG